MKKIHKLIHYSIILSIILSQCLILFPVKSVDSTSLNTNTSEVVIDDKNLKISDVAGTDLYSEQISAYVAGTKSIIRQSLFTNDTNIFTRFDVNDPAFEKCNIYLSVSNGITPEMFPYILNDNIIGTELNNNFNGFNGFLYYDQDIDSGTAQSKANRALEIIKRKFEIDLILVNSSEPNFFSFVAHFPDWVVFLEQTTTNLPMDGYWKALNTGRLVSSDYMNNYHFSASYLLINSLDLLDEGLNITTDHLHFGADNLDLSVQILEDENLLGQLIGGFNGSFELSPDSHYVSFSMQYEGLENGITIVDNDQYRFNLWDVMGYNGPPLSPSKKAYISITGAFLSELDINLLCTDVIDATPEYFEFSDYLIEQLSSLSDFADLDFDLNSLKDYSLELLWVNEDGIYRDYIRPENLDDPEDQINYLKFLGFQGIPYIPTGLLNPIGDLIITYNVSNSEPILRLKKELIGNNASYGIINQFSFNITAENVGNISAWGIPTDISVNITELFEEYFVGNATLAQNLYYVLWGAVEILYSGNYDSLEDFLGLNRTPRVFYFDTWDSGFVNYYYPDITNITNLWPYSEEVIPVIDSLVWPSNFSDKDDLKANFTNKFSIWYEENWKLEPGEKLSYITNNISIADIDSFTEFYKYNFTIKTSYPELPNVISGRSIRSTSPEMALEPDEKGWNIEADYLTPLEYGIEIEFLFENQSNIDLINNTIDRVSINISYTDIPPNLRYEIYNFTEQEYQQIFPSSVTNISRTFTFIDYNKSLNGLFDPTVPNKYRLIFKLDRIDNEIFNISIDNLDVQFSTRDINAIDILGTRCIYSTSSGNAQLDTVSNTYTLANRDSASIEAISYLKSYNSRAGELNTYVIHLKNIGSKPALNINISQLIPGIINESNYFEINGNYLNYIKSQLDPNQEIRVNFTFYTPNSASIRTTISYNNSEYIQNRNSSMLSSFTNHHYLSAPIDYDKRYPFLRTIDIEYRSSSLAPIIGETFNLTVIVINKGPKEGILIPDLNFTMNDKYGDLTRNDNKTLNLNNISYNSNKTFYITLKKNDYLGYFYPSINYFKSSEEITIQISRSSFFTLGYLAFSIDKSCDKEQAEIGEEITVKIEIKNIGTIVAKNIKVNDISSFKESDFTLIKGKLLNKIDVLNPGEEISFKYKIIAKKQNTATLKKAKIDYYFLQKQEDKSSDLDIDILIPMNTQLMLIIIPSTIIIAVIFIYHRHTKKKKIKEAEYEKHEILFLKTPYLLDSGAKIAHQKNEKVNLDNKKLKREEGGTSEDA